VSGQGTTLQALIEACGRPDFPARLAIVVSNVPGVFALERARRAGIPTAAVDHRAHASPGSFEAALRAALLGAGVELVCLAGFLRILTPALVDAFAGRLMNIHPSLLPAFGGRGMYGDRVHAAVLRAGCRITGCTVHFVTAVPDSGPIIAQAAVPVMEDDTVADLAARVRMEELRLYPEAVRLYAEGRLRIEGDRVRALPRPVGAASTRAGGSWTRPDPPPTPRGEV